MLRSRFQWRTSLALLLSGALLGAAIGLARGIAVVSVNAYQDQAPRFARLVLLEWTRSGLIWGLIVVGAVALVWAAALLLARVVARDPARDSRLALVGVLLAAALGAIIWVNKAYLPNLLSVPSIVGNLVMLASVALLIRVVRRRVKPEQWRFPSWLSHASAPVSLLMMFGAVTACLMGPAWASANPGKNTPDVLLIVVDALRPDRLGAYGYARATSPNLDRLAAESWVYTQAISTASWTKPAVASLFTGLSARSHGVPSKGWNLADADAQVAQVSVLSRDLVTLPEVMAEAGYRTAAFGKNHHLAAELGFDQGFEVHDLEIMDRSLARVVASELPFRIRSRAADSSRNTAALINRRFLGWLPGGDQRFFVYLHHIDVHWPYRAPAEFQGRFGARRTAVDFNTQKFFATYGPDRATPGAPEIDPAVLQDMSDAYDESVAFVDHEIGRLLDELRARGRYNQTLIVVTADHGEEFLEHGEIAHGTSLHDVLLRVPLIIKFPCPGEHCGPRGIAEPAQLIDVMPTVLAVAGLDSPPGIEGRSLLEPLAERTLFAERGTEIALRTPAFKYIYDTESSEAELYGLSDDPAERNDLTKREPQLALAFRDRIHQWLEETQEASQEDGGVVADAEMLERLKALGYLK